MKLKLKESIRANGVQYLPPAVVDTDEIGITQADADVLVRRGTAEIHEEPAPVEGTLAGVVEDEGKVVPLDEMKKADLVGLAAEMGIDTEGKTKAQLVEAIQAEKVQAGE